jgi:hypothetical protein
LEPVGSKADSTKTPTALPMTRKPISFHFVVRAPHQSVPGQALKAISWIVMVAIGKPETSGAVKLRESPRHSRGLTKIELKVPTHHDREIVRASSRLTILPGRSLVMGDTSSCPRQILKQILQGSISNSPVVDETTLGGVRVDRGPRCQNITVTRLIQ